MIPADTVDSRRTDGDTTKSVPHSSLGSTRSNITRRITEDGICILTFDRPDSVVNIFDRETMHELSGQLDFIEASSSLSGVILASAKNSIFIAGADLVALSRTKDSAELSAMIRRGQASFSRLAGLKVPTIACIHGACVGGGYEIALACDYRIASPDKATRIGLPETMLGILPAWGGSTRLPRLIGLPKALDIILAGKTVPAKAAAKYGMVDALVPKEYLVGKAVDLIRSRGQNLSRRVRTLRQIAVTNPMAAKLIAHRLQKKILIRTRGHYPAIVKALEVVTRGISESVDDSLRHEHDAILELAQTEACRNLIRIFFLQERSKKLMARETSDGVERSYAPIANAAVVGAGTMGAGIAQWLSSRGIHVVLRDINHDALAKGMAGIAKLYRQAVKRHALTTVEGRAGLDRISPAAAAVPLGNTDVVIEAAIERMDLKQQLFQSLDTLAGPGVILASNTSALSINELASATSHPERVVGVHFFNPVHKMQLVEVVLSKQTAPEVARRVVRFVQQIGKLPVVVKDSPGFLVNRILMPYLIEAGRLFERGARVEDIDESMLDFGMPMGPLRLIDEVGLDVCNHVATDLASKFSDRMRSPEILRAMINDGCMGKKNGRGFYLHDRKRDGDVNPNVDRYSKDSSCAGFSRDALRDRMVLLMVNEAARCLEEGVVEKPDDVDFGMIMGTGWAPFLGGPLRFADSVGISGIVSEMKLLAGKGELEFTPCNLLQTMSGRTQTFYRD